MSPCERSVCPLASSRRRSAGIVVDLAVEDRPDGAVLVRERLMAAGQVDDRQPAEPQRGTIVAVGPRVVGPAVDEPVRHRAERSVRERVVGIGPGRAADAAHSARSTGPWSASSVPGVRRAVSDSMMRHGAASGLAAGRGAADRLEWDDGRRGGRVADPADSTRHTPIRPSNASRSVNDGARKRRPPHGVERGIRRVVPAADQSPGRALGDRRGSGGSRCAARWSG